MEAAEFVDYYETLEVSPKANLGTIERIFRYLAHLYHPDNRETGDRARFDAVIEAHETLKDPGKRSQYDVKHAEYLVRQESAEHSSDDEGIERDTFIQNNLLTALYVGLRKNINEPGLSSFAIERLLGCPAEHLEFHLWYLKEKGWIRATENGLFAITIDGVDRTHSEQHRKVANKLLTHQSQSNSD